MAESTAFEDKKNAHRDLKRPHTDKSQLSQPPKICISDNLRKYAQTFNYPTMSNIEAKYEVLEQIGAGTFGIVRKGRCKSTGKIVAMKKILVDSQKDDGFPITALREIKYLSMIKHPNVTELIEVVSERSTKNRNSKDGEGNDCAYFHLILTFCEYDLCALLGNRAVPFQLPEIKRMAYDFFNGLFKIHKSKLLHRDLKVANILISTENNGTLKIADFGLSRMHTKNEHQLAYTNRVVTLWYRAPEILLGERKYNESIDLWSAGCILAEFFIRNALFDGNSESVVLKQIYTKCGSINNDSMPNCESLEYYKNYTLPQNIPRELVRKLEPIVKDQHALGLIDDLLSLNPAKRPNCDEALDHVFFFQLPKKADSLKRIFDKAPKGGSFEFTAGKGAHANRKPVVPVPPPVSMPVKTTYSAMDRVF
uniref:Protein kinase domain-containing protein n=1 Tax=Rhabditophanes sp. KR3021 TaxID=114890 RepID=A0AC35UCY4_9BILA